MGAGRCASTSLLSFLNKDENFNIYGENNGGILNLLNALFKIKNISNYNSLSKKNTNLNYKHQKYIGSEWYNPKDKVLGLTKEIENSIIDYFPNKEKYIGFKEIRWLDYNLENLNWFEKYYKVKYVHLLRNIDEQSHSMKKLNWSFETNIDDHIKHTNQTINKFLTKKHTSQYIIKNISIDKNFEQEIYNFITV